MNPSEFARRVKDKYPEYRDIDDNELTDKIIAKYPEYKDTVTFEPGPEPEPFAEQPITTPPPVSSRTVAGMEPSFEPEIALSVPLVAASAGRRRPKG